ncbi:cysteine--1-D-myo-inosityl 2-amino-2-deoxy-alpha-D-glucopyranoside ligase [Corynebacterium hindlerae]|uniref:cysteine--1-D-myo-inosityl 2-amino-2-deoxy-alpha-D-glucopyranoside ligase n=1 Tax=Corynebacterium hindlerae TaxID=699041 RepID=UPI001AD79020|nr:cysteine--1-D-myo-inosityl 2-amino-2-deoxy-alpha-D-glucopyranoside ligase [Corynebacterium hindlerae]QTH58807.1 cysteine--1-D-myo-inosityl 2-amino-2-deoxy-alpha-D-glucopyranoside ligase [Corynebacterium hindlerae]
MHSWPRPEVPRLDPALGAPVPLVLFDTSSQDYNVVSTPDGRAGMYVCGITPYDATHLGHAATYLAFDLAYRQLLDNGVEVTYVQNITDVDDPLFERAERDGVDWQELGTSQIDLFRSDMEQLEVLPPQHYVGVMDAVDEVIAMVQGLLDNGSAYQIEGDEYPDVYASIHATEQFGYESNYDRATMEKFFAERGGDPERPGKRDPLDALIWRAARPGEPSWDAPFGAGRPGWHIECSAIATNRLGPTFAIQGGGSDLIFPHHEFSAAHAEALHGVHRMAETYVHTGMMSLNGVKMSKSLGNLVFVSKLTAAGHDPSAIRLGVFAHHYRSDRDWSDAGLTTATLRLERWRSAVQRATDLSTAQALVAELRSALADDLDTPRALAAVDAWALSVANQEVGDSEAGQIVRTAVHALLGVRL